MLTKIPRIAIVSALRTPIGSFCGSLKQYKAQDLGQMIIAATVQKLQIDPYLISEIILGHVLQSGCGQNSARQAAMNAHIPYIVPAWSVNQVCGSGLQSIILAYQRMFVNIIEESSARVKNDLHNIMLVGGQESMTNAMHGVYLRKGNKMGNLQMIDLMMNDGLIDAFSGEHMGMIAENMAEEYKISRAEQDEYALLSQQKALAAFRGNKFHDEIIPIPIDSGSVTAGSEFIATKSNDQGKEAHFLIGDEYIRANSTMESLAKLKSAFKSNGAVTAGNSSGINDGASILALVPEDIALNLRLKPLAYIKSWGQSGVMPDVMGTAPIVASIKALQKAEWTVDNLDVIELNEAFAAQCIAVNREMKWDLSKVNINGGAIALGHPLGCSGARIVTTLVHALLARGGGRGIATACIGGGMGIAICIETE